MRRPEAAFWRFYSCYAVHITFFSLVILFQSTFVLIHGFSLMWTSKCSQQNSIDSMTFDFFSLNFFSLLFSVNIVFAYSWIFHFDLLSICDAISSNQCYLVSIRVAEYFPNSLLVWSHYVCRMKSSLIFVSVHATNNFLVWAFFFDVRSRNWPRIYRTFNDLSCQIEKCRNDVLMMRHTQNRFSQFNTLFCVLTLPKIAAYIETLNSTFR